MKEGKVYCWRCAWRFPRQTSFNEYITSSCDYESWCGATKKFMKCEKRNSEGKCKHFKRQSNDSPW